MSYTFSKIVDCSFEDAINRTVKSLKSEGFGVLTEIDVQATLKEKLNVDFRKYRILGACNPHFAYKALQKEHLIGAMLPCSVIVQETENGSIEVSVIDPVASMQAVQNEALGEVAKEVRQKLKQVVENL